MRASTSPSARADRRGAGARGARHACRRSSARTRQGPAIAAEALFGRLAPRRSATDAARRPSWRSCSPTRGATSSSPSPTSSSMIADQAGRRLHQHPRGAIREDYPRAADLPGPGSPPARACSRTRCSWRRSTTNHFLLGQAAMQINEGLPAYIVVALKRRQGTPARQDGRRPRHGVQGRSRTTSARRSSYKLRKLLEWAGASVLCTDPYVDGPRLRAARRGPRRARPPRSSARRTAPTASSTSPAASRSSTSGTSPATGSGSSMKVLVTGAAGFIAGYLVEELLDGRPRGRRPGQLLEVRPGRARPTTTTRATGSSRATRRTSTCSASSPADVRPVRRRRGDDRRDQLLPRVRLRPARRERADHRRRPSTPPSRAPHRRGRSSSGSSSVELDGVRVATTVFPTPEGEQRTIARRRSRRTASRSWRPSTSRRAPRSSTGCRTRSSVRSTASAIGETPRRPRHGDLSAAT